MSNRNQPNSVRVNQKIRAREVRVIDSEGQQIGILSTSDALLKAQTAGMDLIEVAPNAAPPVCRIMEYGKFKYEQSKKEREIRQHQQSTKTKEIQLHPTIDEHDYQTKLRHVRDFLVEKMKVRVLMCYRGREMAHQEFGKKVIERLLQDIRDIGSVESPPRLNGKTLGVMLRHGATEP